MQIRCSSSRRPYAQAPPSKENRSSRRYQLEYQIHRALAGGLRVKAVRGRELEHAQVIRQYLTDEALHTTRAALANELVEQQ